MIPKTKTHPSKGRDPNVTRSENDAFTRSLLLIVIYCQLHMIRQYIHQLGSDPDDTNPAVTRILARLLTALGQGLDDIEACAAHDACEAGTGEEGHVAFVMSLYFDVREMFDDFLV